MEDNKKELNNENLEGVSGGLRNDSGMYRYKCTRPSCGYAAMYEIKHDQKCPACGNWTFMPMDKITL